MFPSIPYQNTRFLMKSFEFDAYTTESEMLYRCRSSVNFFFQSILETRLHEDAIFDIIHDCMRKWVLWIQVMRQNSSRKFRIGDRQEVLPEMIDEDLYAL